MSSSPAIAATPMNEICWAIEKGIKEIKRIDTRANNSQSPLTEEERIIIRDSRVALEDLVSGWLAEKKRWC